MYTLSNDFVYRSQRATHASYRRTVQEILAFFWGNYELSLGAENMVLRKDILCNNGQIYMEPIINFTCTQTTNF